MSRYVIYNDKNIKRIIDIPDDSMFDVIESNVGESENYEKVDLDFDVSKYKVVDGKLHKQSSDELSRNAANYPFFNDKLIDSEIDAIIDNAFLGGVDVEKWKIDNYAYIRKFFYPKREMYLDGLAKSLSDDEITKDEGNEQIKEYSRICLEVKKRFPKS